MAKSVPLSELKKIRSSDTNLLFGYCREAHQQLLPQNDPYHDVQPLIIYICLAFYHIKHEWDTDNISDDCKINGDFIEKTNAEHSFSILKDEISKGIHQYQFKIVNYLDRSKVYTDIGIGVLFKDKLKFYKDYHSMKYYPMGHGGYIYYALNACTCGYNQVPLKSKMKCKDGDIITLIVDLNNHAIRYKINQHDLGIAFKNIKQTLYRVGLYLYGRCKIQITQ